MNSYQSYLDRTCEEYKRTRLFSHWDKFMLTSESTLKLADLAVDTLKQLYSKIGELAFAAWWMRTFEVDGMSADWFSWKDICEKTQDALDHPEALECDCCLPEQSCQICRSMSHVLSVAQEAY